MYRLQGGYDVYPRACVVKERNGWSEEEISMADWLPSDWRDDVFRVRFIISLGLDVRVKFLFRLL